MSSKIEVTARKIADDYKNGSLDRTLLHKLLTEVQDADSDKDGTKAKIRKYAKENIHRSGEIEIDEDATISLSEDGGAYIQAWVWVQGEQITEPDLFTDCMYNKGVVVLSKDGKRKGKLTGGSRHCGMEGCTGKALAVRWDDGKLTYPCTKGMEYTNGIWKIG
jgi:hypothetical protein